MDSKNLKSIDIDMPSKPKTKEVIAVQLLHEMVKINNSLESVSLGVHDQTSIISILDSC